MRVSSSSAAPVLTFTTDFGLRDHYVGVMKGVIASVASGLVVIDITHEVPSFSVDSGAFLIAQSYRWFPAGSVHVVVVDPGVGSERRAVAARADGHLFIAPDNGVLSQVLERARPAAVRMIDPRHGLERLSRTFHGRDLFAPAAARLATGLAFDRIGPTVDDPVLLEPAGVKDGVGRVLHIDTFGSIVTSFRHSDLPHEAALTVGRSTVTARASSYATAPDGELFLIEGSSGYVEVALDQGSAAAALGLKVGAAVRLAPDRR